MDAPRSARPAPLPSRVVALQAAEAALAVGSLVHVSGDAGSGRSIFSTQLLASRADEDRSLRRIVGSPSLRGVPFAAIAALGMGAPEASNQSTEYSQGQGLELVSSIARIAGILRSMPHTLLIDDAEHLDDASAGVIAQLFQTAQVPAGDPILFEVIITGSADLESLPSGLQQLVLDRAAHHVRLEPLGFEDTQVLLEGLTQYPVNASTVNRLLNLSGGSPLHLRELAFEARARGSLSLIDGFQTLTADWRPVSQRISTLIARRLNKYPQQLRDAIEFIAVLGELSHSAASQLIDVEMLDLAFDVGLLVVTETVSVIDIAQSFDGPGAESAPHVGEALVRLGSGLTPELVLTGLRRGELRDCVTRVRSELPRDALTANARLHLTHHFRRLSVPVDVRELREDAEFAAAAGLSDTVIALTSDLPSLDAATPCARDIDLLLLMRADALSDLGQAETALQTLTPLLAAGHSGAVIRAARIEFDGLNRPASAIERLAARAEALPEAAALLTLFHARRDVPVRLDALEAAAQDERVSPALRLDLLSYLAAERVHRGNPAAGVEIFATHVEGSLWNLAPSAARGTFVQAMFQSMLGDGASLRAFDHHFMNIEWASLALDHAAFLTGRGMIFLEAGEAREATELFGQSAALLSMRDPAKLAGFTAGLDSLAAVMSGDVIRAESQYATWDTAPSLSGGLSRLEGERGVLLVILALHGKAAARARLEELVTGAEHASRTHYLMRLLHDGWRLRLVDRDDDRLGLQRLARVSGDVQGVLATLLRDYAAAFAEVAGCSQTGLTHAEARTVEQLVVEHLEAGRPLYAAEVAARAAELAQKSGDKARGSRLLDLFVQAIDSLGDVNTPSLGRARVQDDALSDREREVCVRAASGLNNAAIAAELFLSPRTVEGHLQRAYTKLGVTDRRQLIA